MGTLITPGEYKTLLTGVEYIFKTVSYNGGKF